MTVLTAVLEAQNKSRLHTWLGEGYTGGEKLVRKAICYKGAYIRGALCIFENKPPPQSGPCWRHGPDWGGGGGGGLFSERCGNIIPV